MSLPPFTGIESPNSRGNAAGSRGPRHVVIVDKKGEIVNESKMGGSAELQSEASLRELTAQRGRRAGIVQGCP
ncbi:MAG: hypothetical protein JO307_25495 [Bryobacterales bacterium]|nr:hypothetical protein [Bryobacterales bacterium]